MKIKLFIAVIAVILLFGSVMVVSQTGSGGTAEKSIEGSEDTNPEIQADLPTKNKSIFFYRVNESRDVGGGGETRQIGNTTYPSGQGHRSDETAFYYTNWYLYPNLAGNLTLDGEFTLSIWANWTEPTSKDIDQLTNLTEVYPSGNENTFEESTELHTFTQGWRRYNHTFQINNYTLTKGSTLKVSTYLEAPSQQSGTFEVGFGGVIDGEMRDANMSIPCQNYIQVDDVYTLDSTRTLNSTFRPDATNKSMYIHANVTDPFGGYDVEWTNLTLKQPDGTVIPGFDNMSMNKTSGSFRSFITEFETQWNYTGYPEGSYNVTIRAVDKQGLRNWEESESFEGHEVYGTHSFFIGGLPYYANLKILDDMGNPLPNTTVVIRKGGGLFNSNKTDSNGITNISFGNTSYDVNAIWEEVEVTGSSIDIDRNRSYSDPLEITVDVVYPEIKIVDDKNNALDNARIYVTHPNGTTNSSAYITGNNGRIQLNRVPAGDFNFLVEWKDKEVADTQIPIDSSNRYEISASVYHFHLQVKDNQGDILNDALVIFEYEDLGIVVSSNLTNQNGNVSARLAGANYNIRIYWKDSVVYDENYRVNSSTTEQIKTDVYHVDVNVYDTQSEPLEEAQITGIYTPTDRKVTTTSTNENGYTMIRLATGQHRFEVDWMGVQVANKTTDISSTKKAVDIYASVYHLDIKAVDNTTDENIIENGSVSVTLGGEVVDTGVTSSDGIYTTKLPETQVDIDISWRGIEVFNERDVAVSGNDQFTATCDVYYVDIEAVDSKNVAVEDSLLNLYQDGAYITNGTTDTNGIERFRLPVENYNITADWKGVRVGKKDFDVVNQRGVNSIVINCDIYYLNLDVGDKVGDPLADAEVETHLEGEIIFSYQTDDQGDVTFKLPKENFDIITSWRGFKVNETSSVVNMNKNTTIVGSVYHVDFRPIDSRGNTTTDTYIEITHEDETYSTGRTDSQGIYPVRIPEEDYNLKAEWDGIEVYRSEISVSENGVFNLTSDIYYLTITGVDAKNKTVENMAVSIYHGAPSQGQDFLDTIDVVKRETIRVPAGQIEFTAQWRGFMVASDSTSVNRDTTQILECEIYYMDINVVDSEERVLDGANLILKDASGDVYTTTSTEKGAVAPRLPTGEWNINVYWNGEFVGNKTVKSLNESTSARITTDVHHLRLKVEGKEGGISGVKVTLLDKNGAPVMTNKTTSNGTLVFSQVVEGQYKIKATIDETQLMTEVKQHKTENVTLDSSESIKLKFNDYPRPFYMTNLFYFVLASILLIGVGAILISRKKEVI